MPWFQMSWPATQFCEAVAWPQLRSRHGQMVSTCTNPNFKRYETLDGCRLWYDVIWSDCKMRLQWYRNLPIPLQRFHVWNTRIPVPTKTSWGMPSGVVRWSCWMAQCLSAAAQYPPGNCTAISFVLDPELWTLKLLVYFYIYIYLFAFTSAKTLFTLFRTSRRQLHGLINAVHRTSSPTPLCSPHLLENGRSSWHC